MIPVGTKVYILFPISSNRLRKGVVYDYLPTRRWQYHVRPDGWSEDKPGIACTEEELEVLPESEDLPTDSNEHITVVFE